MRKEEGKVCEHPCNKIKTYGRLIHWCSACGATKLIGRRSMDWRYPPDNVDALSDKLLEETIYPVIYSNGKGRIVSFTEKGTNLVCITRKGNLSDALREALKLCNKVTKIEDRKEKGNGHR